MPDRDNRLGQKGVGAGRQEISPLDSTVECRDQTTPEPPPRQWGHLRVLELLGRGGSSEVYRVWDEKLERQSALKLFRPDWTGSGAPSSREARVLARLRHGNVVTIYGVDVREGRLGLWMELIHGRTLESIVRSDGPLSASEACLIGIDLCRALGEVHRAGLIHRDIKPQNVMREEGGRTVLMDFGLADNAALTGDGRPDHLCGTPAYMAPETLRGEPATVASDVYSLGTLLFFLVSGSYRVDAATFAQAQAIHETGRTKSLAEIRPDLSERFLAVIERATASDPGARFASTAEMRRALAACLPVDQAPAAKAWYERAWRQAVAVLVGIAIIAAGLALWLVRPGTDRTAVLISDLENRTSDPWLGTMAQDLLTIALEQSRRFYIVPRGSLAETLQLMRLPPSTPVDASVGAQVARREGIRILLSGAVMERPGRYEIIVRAVDPAQSKTAATSTASFASKNELATAIGRIAGELRHSLGEASSDVARSSLPLARVTTNSYDALVAYTTGMRVYGEGRPDEALPLMQRSVETDPEFAMAHRQLATLYSSLGRSEASLDSVTRAYGLRDRTTERERLLIEALYHLRRADYMKSLESYKLVSALYPEDPVAQYQMAQLQAFVGDVNAAIEAMKKAVRIEPRTELYRGLLAQLLIQANRPDDALKEITGAGTASHSESFLRRVEGTAWLAKGDYARADAIFRNLLADGGTESWARVYQAQSDMLQGKLRDALLQLDMAAGSHAGRSNRDNDLKGRGWAARIHLLLGHHEAALLQASMLEAQRPTPANLRALRNAGLIYAAAEDQAGAARVAELLDKIANEFPSSYTKAAALQVRGELSLLQGRVPEAGTQLQQAWTHWADTLTLWSLGNFREAQGDDARAASLYERMIADKGNILLQEPMLLWVLAHYRLATCAFRLGDTRRAGAYATRFRTMWGHLDLPQVRKSEQMIH
jgi:serine/threonine-protein kinase